MQNQLSRRAAMLALASTGAIASTAAAALVDVNAAEAAAWDSALAEYNAALAAKDAFGPTYDRIEAAHEANRPSMDTIPWKEFTFEDHHAVARVMDVEKRWAFFLAGEGKWWWAPGREEARKAEYRTALDAVLEFRRQEAEHDERSGMKAAEAHYEALWARFSNAADALLNIPAPNAAALLWKLEYMWLGDEEASWSTEAVSSLLADARRLLAHGRA